MYSFTRDILSGPRPVTVFILDVTVVFVIASIYCYVVTCVWYLKFVRRVVYLVSSSMSSFLRD